jgi:hypothetical protein
MNTTNNIMSEILDIRNLSELIKYIPSFMANATYEKHSKR